jgi:hypothetical protein
MSAGKCGIIGTLGSGTTFSEPFFTHTSGFSTHTAGFSTNEIMVNGRTLTSILASMEERLGLIHRNMELEQKWSELFRLGEQYRALEKELTNKENMWRILNK